MRFEDLRTVNVTIMIVGDVMRQDLIYQTAQRHTFTVTVLKKITKNLWMREFFSLTHHFIVKNIYTSNNPPRMQNQRLLVQF
jgi:hypothetical protein